MGKYDYYEGKFPYASDVAVTLGNGTRAVVGRHTYGIESIAVHSWGSRGAFSIGRFSAIGQTQFFLGGNHPSHFLAQGLFLPKHFSNADAVESTVDNDSFFFKGDITIGSDVWIGNFSTIMSGVNVGDGAVIAANAHVVRDVAPYSMVGGNPAKHIKFRFSEDMIERLMVLRWWELDDDVINAILGRLRAKATPAELDELIGLCRDCKRTKIPRA